MTNGSINIDDIKGKVSGVSYGSTGSLSAEVINIQGNLTIVVNNPTAEVIAELKKIQQVRIEASGSKDQGITTRKVVETRQSIDWFKNLLSKGDNKVGTQTQAIRAGNVEISRTELLSKDAGTMAYEYIQKGDYYNGLEWSNKATQMDPNNAITWYNRGLALNNLGKNNEAIQSYDRAIQIDPNYADAWYNKGWNLGKLGKHNEAIQSYDRAIQIDPNYAAAWDNKAKILGESGKFDEAIQSIDRALQIVPSTVDTKYNKALTWHRKGWNLGKLGKHNEAIQSYDRAIQIDPNYAAAWYNKGWNLEKLGRYGEAKQFFDRAKQLGYKG